MIKFFRPIQFVVEARCLLDDENQEQVAEWCGGKLRGTKLLRAARVIQIDIHGVEHEAEVGDWIIKWPDNTFTIYPGEEFYRRFRPA